MKHIVIIEPDKVLATTYGQAFRHAGYKVALANGAQSGVHAADETTPDVVLLELQLGAHDGVEFLHEFRSYADWDDVPVIVNTLLPPEKTTPVIDALRRDFGVHAVLYKPQTSLKTLLSEVNKALKARP